jgi:hypothetical protein
MAKKFEGFTIIHEGVDQSGQPYRLVHYKGGSKYFWGEDGEESCWERFDNSSLKHGK